MYQYGKVCVGHTLTVFTIGTNSSCLSRFSQMDCDSHLAQCLSEVNMDMTWWVDRMLAAVQETWAAQMSHTLHHHIIWRRTHPESTSYRECSLFIEVLTPSRLHTERGTPWDTWGNEDVVPLEKKTEDGKNIPMSWKSFGVKYMRLANKNSWTQITMTHFKP